MTFDGSNIFGTYALRCAGPFPLARSMRERLPGVDGFRIFRLGMDSVTWNCSGRVLAVNKVALGAALWNGAAYELQQTLHTFRTTWGAVYENCLLTGWGPETQISRLDDGRYTVRVRGTVTWLSPSV